MVRVDETAEDHEAVTHPGSHRQGATGFASPLLSQAGERWTHVFTQPAACQQHCTPHLMMGMTGEIMVGARSSPCGFHQPSRAAPAARRDRLLA